MYLAQPSLIEYLFFIIHICYNIERGEMNEKNAKSTFSFNDCCFHCWMFSKTTTEKATKKTKTLSGNYQVEIKVKDYGTIYAEIDADTAPITVTNFVKLSKEKFYDDLTFHRIIDGFMIQGGDPKGDGTGGSKETIKGEFSDNGVKNPLSHTRGALSMARSQDNDSASSHSLLFKVILLIWMVNMLFLGMFMKAWTLLIKFVKM